MVFTILITIVFIAELIIAFAVVWNLFKFDKTLEKLNSTVEENKAKIKDIAVLCREISAQIVELAPVWVDTVKDYAKKLAAKQAESILSTILFWTINIKLVKKLRKNKITKFLSKGLSLLQNVV